MKKKISPEPEIRGGRETGNKHPLLDGLDCSPCQALVVVLVVVQLVLVMVMAVMVPGAVIVMMRPK